MQFDRTMFDLIWGGENESYVQQTSHYFQNWKEWGRLKKLFQDVWSLWNVCGLSL